MKEKTLKRIWKEFPELYALIQNWDFFSCEIKIKLVDDDFIEWLMETSVGPNIELWLKYRKFDSSRKIQTGEGIQRLTKQEGMSFSQALFRISANWLPEYLIIKEIDQATHGSIAFIKITIIRPPKNKTWVQIMQRIKENKLKW